MSTLKVPNSEKQIIQPNNGDYGGNLYSTFNIDLDSSKGVIKPSKRLTRVLDATQWGTDDIIQALQIHDGYYHVATSDDVWQCSVNNDPTNDANWSAVSTLGAEDLGVETDMASYNGLLLVSLGTDIMTWDGSTKDDNWWTTVAGGTALTALKPHTLEVLRTGTDTLFITDGNKIRYYNGAAAGTIITLDTFMTANCFTPSLDKMWVGTYTEVENNAFVYEIQVGQSLASAAYEIDGNACLTMFTHRNTPFVVTSRGYIQAFNGAGFETVAQFPWASESKVMAGCRPGLVQDSPTSLAIHPKGSKVTGKYAYIYVNTDDEYTTSNLTPRAASGVWVLDLETYSLTHKYSLTDETTDYGVQVVSRSGPLLITNTPETRIMVGGSIGAVEGVWMETDATNQGYFTTIRHESDSTADAFETVVIKTDTLDTGNSVTVKYKDEVVPNFPLEVQDITWLNANQFTTTNTLTNVSENDEVEIISGYYAGNMFTVLEVTGETTKTVTLDTDIGVLGEVSSVYIDRWKPIEPTITEDNGEYTKLGAGNGSTAFRQYKVILTGDVTLREVISKTNSKNEL